MGRYLRLAKETTGYGIVDASPSWVDVRAESIELLFDPNFTYHRTVEGGRFLQTAQSARQLSQGPVDLFPVYDKGLGEILHMLAGKVTTTVLEASLRWQHVFELLKNITTTTNMPSYTVAKGLDDITEERYPGGSMGRLTITANPADFVKLVAQMFAKKPTTPAIATGLSFSSQDYLNAGQVVTQTLNGVTTKFEAFSIEINGGAFPVFKPGSKEPDSIDLESADVKVSFTTRFLSASDLTDFLNASQKALVYKWQGSTLGAGNYSLQLDIPKMNFDEGDVRVNQQERLVQARRVTAIEDSVNGMIKFTLVNNKSAY
jgi:hypothetical protein